MTLIVGIKCKDGVVVGSDGAATLGFLGNGTALQPTKKLTIFDQKLIIGVSGSVGLGQRIIGEIEGMWSGHKVTSKKSFEVMAQISQDIRKHIKPELEMAMIARNTLGNAGLSDALTTTILALPVDHEAHLFQFSQQGSPEEATELLPFICIGSGQTIADPFLAYIRRIFWPNTCPNVSDGIFATLWTLQHAIDTNTGGVAEPIQIAKLTKNGSDWEAVECKKEELEEHEEAISSAEDKLRHFKESIHSDTVAQDIPHQ